MQWFMWIRKVFPDRSVKESQMKIADILNDVRTKLNDHDKINFSMTADKILDMVRARLNDSTDVNTDYSVERLLMDVRKNMGDTDKVAFSLTVARVLSDVRDRLNDSNDFSYTYSLKRLIQEIRNNVSDNDNVTCSLNMSDILAKVRDNLGDNDSGTSTINQTEVLKQIRYNLDDSVLPYRWSDADLKSYMSAGIRDILLKRSDCAKKNTTMIRDKFSSALVAYATASAFEHEAEDKNDAERRNFYWEKYQAELKAVPFRWETETLVEFAASGLREIIRRRVDCRSVINVGVSSSSTITISDKFENALIHYILSRALEESLDFPAESEKYKLHRDRFLEEIQTVPFHWDDTDYSAYINDAVREIIRKRQDCKDIVYKETSSAFLLNSKFIPAVIAHVSARIQEMKGNEAYKINLDRFDAELKKVPFHWQNSDLLLYVNDAVRNIIRRRSDCSDLEYKTLFESSSIPVSDKFLLPINCYVLARAFEQALDYPNASEKYKLYQTQFFDELKSIPYHFSDEELLNVLKDALLEVYRRRGDCKNEEFSGEIEISGTLPLSDKYVPALLAYIRSKLSLQTGDVQSQQGYMDQFFSFLSMVPWHWTDQKLKEFLNSGIREIIRKRPDCKFDIYLEEEDQTVLPISDKFEQALVAYIVFRCLEEHPNENWLEYYRKSYENELSNIPFHWSDAEFISYLNQGVREIRRRRPDERMNKYGMPAEDYVDVSEKDVDVPLRDSFFSAITGYIAAKCVESKIGMEKPDRFASFINEFNQIRGEK